jgi:hypothetical protein
MLKLLYLTLCTRIYSAIQIVYTGLKHKFTGDT